MWRFLTNKEKLWVKVVESKYGMREGDFLHFLGRDCERWSGWWKDIVKHTIGENGEWLKGRLERIIGAGKNTSFWEDICVGGEPLKVIFPRLLCLSSDMNAMVGDMGVWEEGRWRWTWRCRRGLLEREFDTFNALVSLINRAPLNQGVQDSWRWAGESKGSYNTKEAYTILTDSSGNGLIDKDKERGFKFIWNKFTPLKVITHSWRVLWDRLPTKMNLHRRNILNSNANLKYVFCDKEDETGKHIFFECDVSHKVWIRCFEWLGFSMVIHSDPCRNLLAHNLLFKEKMSRQKAVTIWLCVIWLI
ncbi:hypothetical protein ACS0TY_007123 [Phlomoides rotata]